MEQLQTMNADLMKAARRRQWPGTGPADERLLTVCENLTTAAELLPRRRTDVRPMRPEVEADLDAAKARLMHVLYVGAHGVQVALNRDLRDLAVMPASKRAALPAESMKRTVEARDRMAAFEQLAGSYVSGTFPAALRRRAQTGGGARPAAAGAGHLGHPGPPRPGRSPHSRDDDAHRADPGAHRLRQPDAAARRSRDRRDRTPPVPHPPRAGARVSPSELGRPRDEPGRSSHRLARTPARAADLVMAANEIRAAMLEIIHDRTGVASVETLAATVDLKQVSQTLQLGLATSTDLAYALREATADPHLLASARGVNAMAMALEARGPYGNVSTEAWVRPVDHAQDRPVALPDMVRDSLTRAADQVTQAAKTAAGAAAFVSAPEGIPAARTSARQSDS